MLYQVRVLVNAVVDLWLCLEQEVQEVPSIPVPRCLFLLRRDTSEGAKPSKQEVRKAEAAMKRQKMREEQQREKDKVKDRLDLIRQMKGNTITLACYLVIQQCDGISHPVSL